MTNKKAYKQLRKNLTKDFINPYFKEYRCYGAIESWVNQCGIKCSPEHVYILCRINGGTVYPYQKSDRKLILKYLKGHEKWQLV